MSYCLFFMNRMTLLIKTEIPYIIEEKIVTFKYLKLKSLYSKKNSKKKKQ